MVPSAPGGTISTTFSPASTPDSSRCDCLVGTDLLAELLVLGRQRVVLLGEHPLRVPQRGLGGPGQRRGTDHQANGERQEDGNDGDQVVPEVDH
jgi:hypothetical protein